MLCVNMEKVVCCVVLCVNIEKVVCGVVEMICCAVC